jgi:hypothetical protein
VQNAGRAAGVLVHGLGALRQQALRMRWVLGKAMTSRIDSAPVIMRDDAIQAESQSAVRRGAVLERIQQEAELELLLFRADVQRARTPWTARRRGGYAPSRRRFPSRSGEVVGLGQALARIRSSRSM